jgi:hypothetical protein
MKNTVIINGHTYTLIPYKTEEELDKLRNMCGYGPGYCQCGCGQKTTIADTTVTCKGWIKGTPKNYVHGHNRRIAKDGTFADHPTVKVPGHPSANNSGHVREHLIRAEEALGKPIPATARVHHFTEEQLVICEDAAYHNLLHRRQRAYETCGHASWLKCKYCHEYDDPKNMVVRKRARRADSYTFYHRDCHINYAKEYRKRQKHNG